MKDYYEILEVSRKASKDTINKVFKMHMKANHPDLFQGDEKIKAEEKSKELTEAYNTLSDDNARAKYDAELEAEEASNNNQYAVIMQENEYLKQVIAQKDSYISQLTNNGNGYNPYGAQQYQNQYANQYQNQYGAQYQNQYGTQYQNPYGNQQYGYNNFQQQDDPYAGMTLEELQALKKEQTKILYKQKIKELASKLIVLGLLLIVLIICFASSARQLGAMFGE